MRSADHTPLWSALRTVALPARRRHPVDPEKYPGLTAYDTRALGFGSDRRVVLTHLANLAAKQARGFDQTLAKTTRALAELAATVARGKTRRPPAAVAAAIAAPRWVNRVIQTELTGTTPAQLRLTWQVDPAARQTLEDRISRINPRRPPDLSPASFQVEAASRVANQPRRHPHLISHEDWRTQTSDQFKQQLRHALAAEALDAPNPVTWPGSPGARRKGTGPGLQSVLPRWGGRGDRGHRSARALRACARSSNRSASLGSPLRTYANRSSAGPRAVAYS